jgi:hypothetical protein
LLLTSFAPASILVLEPQVTRTTHAAHSRAQQWVRDAGAAYLRLMRKMGGHMHARGNPSAALARGY